MKIDKIMTQVYFENIEEVISSLIASSRKSIQIAVAWFTNQRLCDCLVEALKRKVNVNILLLDDILNRNEFGIDFGVLTKYGADVRFANSAKGTMHNKFCIIDDIVITGSYNWTYHANNNDENILLTEEPTICDVYRQQFDALFKNGTPITLPYEHLKWTDVKEGDFSELRRNICRDVVAENDENSELKRIKLINLDQAYKSGDAGELVKASSLATEQHFRTITDVLTSRSQDFTLKLWEENVKGRQNTYGICKWWYIPYGINKDEYQREYVEGVLKINAERDVFFAIGLELKIYDKEYIAAIKKVLGSETLSYTTRKNIPDYMLRINRAKMFYYQFPSPMYNKKQERMWKNYTQRTIAGINLFGIVKEVNDDKVVFYDGWDPQKRGEQIMKEFFVNVL